MRSFSTDYVTLGCCFVFGRRRWMNVSGGAVDLTEPRGRPYFTAVAIIHVTMARRSRLIAVSLRPAHLPCGMCLGAAVSAAATDIWYLSLTSVTRREMAPTNLGRSSRAVMFDVNRFLCSVHRRPNCSRTPPQLTRQVSHPQVPKSNEQLPGAEDQKRCRSISVVQYRDWWVSPTTRITTILYVWSVRLRPYDLQNFYCVKGILARDSTDFKH